MRLVWFGRKSLLTPPVTRVGACRTGTQLTWAKVHVSTTKPPPLLDFQWIHSKRNHIHQCFDMLIRWHEEHLACKTRNSAIADKTRDAFIDQSRSPNMVQFHMLRKVSYYYAIATLSVEIRLQKCHDLQNWVTGPWRSLKMSPFDREPTTSYWRSIVTMALSRVASEIFNVEKYRDLEIPVKGQSRSSKVVPFDRLGMVSY